MSIRLYRLGRIVTDVIGDVKTGIALVSDTNYMTFEYPIATDFVVTAGKTLYITQLLMYSTAGTKSAGIGYGDDGVGDGAAAPTTPVRISTDFTVVTAYDTKEFNVLLTIPAGKYPYVKSASGVFGVQFFGIEL